jgi:hypothetical protein
MRFPIILAIISCTFFALELNAQTAINDCNVFETGPNATWQYVLTATTADDANSNQAQTLDLSMVSLPEGGTNYRVVKTTANGNFDFGPAMDLQVGENSVTVSAVSFARTVKFQFSNGEGEFETLILNDEDINTCTASEGGTPIAECAFFEVGTNDSWPFVLTAATADDANSNEAQSLEFVVSSLPENGADYRIVKTVANGQWNFGPAVALEIGSNSITVTEVSFARAVKFQFSSGDVEFTFAVLNDEELSCGSEPCEDANDNGVCDDEEIDPSFYCGTGTEWNEVEGKCVALPQCTGDIDLDGSINVSDLLLFLSVFGTDC